MPLRLLLPVLLLAALSHAAPTPAQEAVSPAPSADNDGLAKAFQGAWQGDAEAYAKSPLAAKLTAANPQLAQTFLAMMRTATLQVTDSSMTITAMGQKAGPAGYRVASASEQTLVIEMTDGPQKGMQTAITFQKDGSIKVVQGRNETRALYFRRAQP
jgi:hypothetical protein